MITVIITINHIQRGDQISVACCPKDRRLTFLHRRRLENFFVGSPFDD
jgi:hypothetical protein